MSQKSDSRSALSIGMDWGARITTIGLEFALPACLGFGLDRWWNTGPAMTIAGALLGMAVGMLHVIRLASDLPGSSGPRRPKKPGPPEGPAQPL